jgi:predicted dehydrogenase
MTAGAGPTVGIVGLGWGRAHIPAYQANGCRVVAVCQRDQSAAKAIAERYGVPQVFERWEEMLDRARPDIVVIATPTHLHHAIALRAFAAGAHVVCEKPLAMSRREGTEMAAAAERAGRIAMTDFNWRFPAAMQRFHAMLEDGAVGRVFHVFARWQIARWADERAAPTWRLDRSLAGHGAMGDVGVHMIDLVRWNFGEIRRLAAHSGIAYPSRTVPGGAKPADTDDFTTVVAELESGAQLSLMVTAVARGSSEQLVEAYGTRGGLRYRLDQAAPRWWDGELQAIGTSGAFAGVDVPSTPPGDTRDGREVIGRTMIGPLVAELLDGIKTGRTPSPSLGDGVRAQAVLDAVIESTSRRGWVDVAG